GVTFMAFGNGAPDVFGAIASVLSSPTPKADLALGELFGAGLFVTTMVLAVTIFTRPFEAEVFSSIRDIAFYVVALACIASFYPIRSRRNLDATWLVSKRL
uniref:Na_Ca_ex domain-containing protein n=2 Tax=Caenorhabditis japonica TaxID=281687 RepID=A0A8R1EWC0_CAEJA